MIEGDDAYVLIIEPLRCSEALFTAIWNRAALIEALLLSTDRRTSLSCLDAAALADAIIGATNGGGLILKI